MVNETHVVGLLVAHSATDKEALAILNAHQHPDKKQQELEAEVL